MSVRNVGKGRLVTLLAAIALVVATLGVAAPTSAQGMMPSIVYLDASKPAGTSVWVMASDGSSRHVVGDLLAPGLRALDMRGSLLAAVDANDLITVNLDSGETKHVAVGARIQSAYVANASTVFYSTHPGCGPVEAKPTIGRVNVATGANDRITDLGTWPGSEVLRYDAGADELTVASRSCDPGIGELWIVNARTGDTRQKIPVDGCGWAAIAPAGGQALLSYDLCKLGGNDAFPDLRAYDLPGGAAKEIRFTKDAPSRHRFVYAPDGKRAAYGLALDRDTGGTTPQSGGIWTLDTASMERTKLWQDQGQESWAIGWSPDGSKLLVASREGENVCAFSMIDVPSAKATTIDGVTNCDEKGTLVGFISAP